MHNNNNGRRNNNNRRFSNNKGHNGQNKRRFGGGGGNSNNFDDESSNISIQQRKNFANKQEQYLLKAKDALRNGDRVEAENYYQHADHCFRMMNLGLANGSKFDPVRMHIQNANYNANNGDHNEAQHGNSHEAQPSDGNGGNNSDNSGGDISSLPFLREPINPGNGDPRIIE